MENDEKALNQEVREETNQPATPADESQTAEEAPIESTEPASEEETKEVETEQKEPKKGANHRIRELSGEIKSLKQKLAEAAGGAGEIPAQTAQIPVDVNDEVSPDQYRQHIL